MSSTGTRSIRVLLVGYDPALLDGVEASPGAPQTRVEIDAVPTAEAALGRLDDSRPDCLVSDYELPGTNGVELLETVRERHSGLPFVLFTEDGSEHVAAEAISAGVTEYVPDDGDGDADRRRLVDAIDAAAATAERDSPDGLERTNRRLEAVCETVPAPVFLKTTDGQYLLMNDACRSLFGLEEDDRVEGLTDDDLFPPESAAACRRSDAEVVDEGGIVESEEAIRTADGDRLYLTRKGPIYGSNGEVEAICGVSTDITERNERVQSLRTFEQALERAGNPIYWTDGTGTIEYVNAAFESTTGYSAAEAIGATPWELLTPGDLTEEFCRSIRETVRAGDVWEGEVVNRRRDGGTYTAKQTVASVETGGEAERFVVVKQDVTEERRAKERLTEYAETLEQLQRTTQTLLGTTTVESAAATVIRSLENVFDFDIAGIWIVDDSGTRLEPVQQTTASEGLITDPPVYTADSDSLSWGAFETEETRYIRDMDEHEDRANTDTPIGSELIVPIAGYGVLNVGSTETDAFTDRERLFLELWADTVASALARIEQIQRLERREAELVRERDRLDRFADTFRHELRNPLNILGGYLDVARETGDEAAFQRCQTAIDRIQHLLEDALLILGEDPELTRTPVELAAVSEACWAAVTAGTADTGAAADLRIERDRQVYADEARFCQLLENLLRNAIEHGGRDVSVTIGGTDEGFYVEDDGPGIPERERGKIFEDGYSTTVEGSGLGLAVVAAVADAHGWEIRVADGTAGGARFEVAIPDAEHE